MSASPVSITEPVSRSAEGRWQNFCEAFLQPAVLIRVVLYLTVLIYLRTIFFDYVYDDNELIILNPWMQSWKYVPDIFTHSFWGFTEALRGVDYYRPLVMLTLVGIRRLLGAAPGWFHLVAAGLHVFAVFLTYRLAVETTGDKRLSAIAAGIFGLHPTKVESAAWISGISDTLCAVFFLGAMIQYFKWVKLRELGRGRWNLFLSLALLLLAFLSKEAAIFAPVLIAIYEFSSCKSGFFYRCRTMFRSVWPFAAVAGAAVAVRLKVVHVPATHILANMSGLTTLYTAPRVVLWYLGKQFWPVSLSLQYPQLLIAKPLFSSFVLPLCLLLAVFGWLLWAIRNSAIGILFASWFALMLAPVVLYQVRLQQHDRYFYLASVASSIGLAYLISSVKHFGPMRFAAVLLAIFAALTLFTLNYESYWDNDEKLFTRVVQIAPYNDSANRYLASIYIGEEQPEKAKALAERLMNDPSGKHTGWFIRGAIELQNKNYEDARTDMQASMRLASGNKLVPSVVLADTDLLLHRNEEATELYREQLKHYPDIAYLHTQLAKALKNASQGEEPLRSK